jgi:hypothetical protein
MSIRIQPRELQDKTLPYPYFIDEKTGAVGRQDFWKGHPLKLIGFSDLPKAGDINLTFEEFVKRPKRAVGRYPVFENEGDKWVTHTNPIESVS